MPRMARVLVPVGRTPRARVCVVCGEVESVELRRTRVRPTRWWLTVFALVAFAGLPGVIVMAYMTLTPTPAVEVQLPFTERCFRTWRRVRVASWYVILVALVAPPMVLITTSSPALLLRASATSLVLLLVPVLLRFGPARLGPVFRRANKDEIVVDLPSEDAAAALTREGWE